MEEIVKNEFQFYCKLARPLVMNMPKPRDRILAAAWIKKFMDENSGSEKLRTMYLKLLLFCLQRRKLTGIFADDPLIYDALEELPPECELTQLAQNLLKQEKNEKKEQVRQEMMGDMPVFPPYTTDCSADLNEYVAAQDIPNFGVHAYYALSKQPINRWQRAEKAILPKGVKSAIDATATGAVALEEPSCVCKPKGVRSAPDTEEATEADCRDKKDKEPEKKKRRPRNLGQSPPTHPIGEVRHVEEERPTPTWGTNLLEVKEPTDIGKINEPTEEQIQLERQVSKMIEQDEEEDEPEEEDTAAKAQEMLGVVDEWRQGKLDKSKAKKSPSKTPKQKTSKIPGKAPKKGKGGFGKKPANLDAGFEHWTEEDLAEEGLTWADLVPVDENIDDELQRIEDEVMGQDIDISSPSEGSQNDDDDDFFNLDYDAMIKEAEEDLAKSVYDYGVEEDEPVVENYDDQIDEIEDVQNISRALREVQEASPALVAGIPVTTPKRSPTPGRSRTPERVFAEEDDDLLKHRLSPLRPPKPKEAPQLKPPPEGPSVSPNKDPHLAEVFQQTRVAIQERIEDQEGRGGGGGASTSRRSPPPAPKKPAPRMRPLTTPASAMEGVLDIARQQEAMLWSPPPSPQGPGTPQNYESLDSQTCIPCSSPEPMTEDEQFEFLESLYASPQQGGPMLSPTSGQPLPNIPRFGAQPSGSGGRGPQQEEMERQKAEALERARIQEMWLREGSPEANRIIHEALEDFERNLRPGTNINLGQESPPPGYRSLPSESEDSAEGFSPGRLQQHQIPPEFFDPSRPQMTRHAPRGALRRQHQLQQLGHSPAQLTPIADLSGFEQFSNVSQAQLDSSADLVPGSPCGPCDDSPALLDDEQMDFSHLPQTPPFSSTQAPPAGQGRYSPPPPSPSADDFDLNTAFIEDEEMNFDMLPPESPIPEDVLLQDEQMDFSHLPRSPVSGPSSPTCPGGRAPITRSPGSRKVLTPPPFSSTQAAPPAGRGPPQQEYFTPPGVPGPSRRPTGRTPRYYGPDDSLSPSPPPARQPQVFPAAKRIIKKGRYPPPPPEPYYQLHWEKDLAGMLDRDVLPEEEQAGICDVCPPEELDAQLPLDMYFPPGFEQGPSPTQYPTVQQIRQGATEPDVFGFERSQNRGIGAGPGPHVYRHSDQVIQERQRRSGRPMPNIPEFQTDGKWVLDLLEREDVNWADYINKPPSEQGPGRPKGFRVGDFPQRRWSPPAIGLGSPPGYEAAFNEIVQTNLQAPPGVPPPEGYIPGVCGASQDLQRTVQQYDLPPPPRRAPSGAGPCRAGVKKTPSQRRIPSGAPLRETRSSQLRREQMAKKQAQQATPMPKPTQRAAKSADQQRRKPPSRQLDADAAAARARFAGQGGSRIPAILRPAGGTGQAPDRSAQKAYEGPVGAGRSRRQLFGAAQSSIPRPGAAGPSRGPRDAGLMQQLDQHQIHFAGGRPTGQFPGRKAKPLHIMDHISEEERSSCLPCEGDGSRMQQRSPLLSEFERIEQAILQRQPMTEEEEQQQFEDLERHYSARGGAVPPPQQPPPPMDSALQRRLFNQELALQGSQGPPRQDVQYPAAGVTYSPPRPQGPFGPAPGTQRGAGAPGSPPAPSPAALRQEIRQMAQPQFDPVRRRDVLRRDDRRSAQPPIWTQNIQEEEPLIPCLPWQEPPGCPFGGPPTRQPRRKKKKESKVDRYCRKLVKKYNLPPLTPEEEPPYTFLDESIPERLQLPSPMRPPLRRPPPPSPFVMPPLSAGVHETFYQPPPDLPIHPDLVDLEGLEVPMMVPEGMEGLDAQQVDNLYFTPERFPSIEEGELDREAMLNYQPPAEIQGMWTPEWGTPGTPYTPDSVGYGPCGSYTPFGTPPLGLLEDNFLDDALVAPNIPDDQMQEFFADDPDLTLLDESLLNQGFSLPSSPDPQVQEFLICGGTQNLRSPDQGEFEMLERQMQEEEAARQRRVPRSQIDFAERRRQMIIADMAEQAERIDIQNMMGVPPEGQRQQPRPGPSGSSQMTRAQMEFAERRRQMIRQDEAEQEERRRMESTMGQRRPCPAESTRGAPQPEAAPVEAQPSQTRCGGGRPSSSAQEAQQRARNRLRAKRGRDVGPRMPQQSRSRDQMQQRGGSRSQGASSGSERGGDRPQPSGSSMRVPQPRQIEDPRRVVTKTSSIRRMVTKQK